MTALLAYPPSSPRLVTDPADREAAAPYVAGASPAARARWRLAGTPLGRWLWRAPSPSVEAAWNVGVGLLGNGRQPIVGVLSDGGAAQRLTLIPSSTDLVAKVAVHPTADAVVVRERACLERLAETGWADLGPRVRGGAAAAPRAALLMDRVAGRHPRWDDRAVHAQLLRVLAGPDGGLHHGDVTPWNVVVTDDGGLKLLDWEFADFEAGSDPVCSLLDYVVRGAVVARARVARVRSVLRDAGVASPAVLAQYRSYRARVREVSDGRPDALSREADRLLRACVGEEARP